MQSRDVTTWFFALIFVSAVAPAAVQAGNPCPIGVRLYNLGLVPDAKPELVAAYGTTDPLFAALVAHAQSQDCIEANQGTIQDGKLDLALHEGNNNAPLLQVDRLKQALVGKAFRCQQAARDVAVLGKTANESGAILYLRGHKRVLLVMPKWASLCLDTKTADKLSPKDIAKTWTQLSKKMIADRHANP